MTCIVLIARGMTFSPFFNQLVWINEKSFGTVFCSRNLPYLLSERMALLDKIKSINCSILKLSDAVVIKNPLFWDNTLSSFSNTLILNSTIDCVISTKRFDDSILTHSVANILRNGYKTYCSSSLKKIPMNISLQTSMKICFLRLRNNTNQAHLPLLIKRENAIFSKFY